VGSSRAGGNRERVVKAALELFNDRGVTSVSTNHIADHIGVSRGNLHWHFKNKEEIVRELFEQLKVRTDEGAPLPSGGEIAPREWARYYVNTMSVLWEFRFYWADVDAILRADPLLVDSHRDYALWLRSRIVELFELLMKQGDMRAPEPYSDLVRIAENMWIVTESWWRFSRTVRPGHTFTVADARDGAYQAFLVLEPFTDRKFASEVREALSSIAP
jgi:AcrR family transcriptional regulator